MRRVEHVMGFPVSLRVDDEGIGDEVADALFAWLREVDARFSPFRPDSEVCRYDRGELQLRDLSADLTEVLDLCEQYRLATGGAFDVRLPGRPLDPCAVVKGWSVQRAAELLTAAGARRFILNAGGDVVVAGGPWRVGVRHPEHADQLCTVLELTDGAVATSGYGAEVVDPHTGQVIHSRGPATVTGPTLAVADGFATALFAAADAGLRWFDGTSGYEPLVVAGHPVKGMLTPAA